MVGGTNPRLVVLAFIRKKVEKTRTSRLVSSTPLWPLSQFLPSGSYLVLVPFLTSFNNEQQCGSIGQINLPFGRGVSSQQ